MTTESRSAFARRLGVSPSWITQLAQDGRLVLSADSGQVEVEASLARIEATRDPNREDVRERHARERGEKPQQEHAGGLPIDFQAEGHGVGQETSEKRATGQETASAAAGSKDSPMQDAAEVFRRARAVKMHYDARMAVLRLARLQGLATETRIVARCAMQDGATLRATLENLPDQLAPRLTTISEACEASGVLGGLLDKAAATLDELLARNVAAMRATLS